MTPQETEPDDWIPDGDANVDTLTPLGGVHHEYSGDRYQNTEDPDWENVHHIYLIVSPSRIPDDKNTVTVADNQMPKPHPRNIMGAGYWSKTKYLLRAV